MAKKMPGRTISRPAQGNRSSHFPPPNPRPAYKPDAAPVVKNVGTLSHPKKNITWRPSLRNTDKTPKVVQS